MSWELLIGVYDTKDNDVCVLVGTTKEVAKYFKTSTEVIASCLSRHQLKDRRFMLERVGKVYK